MTTKTKSDAELRIEAVAETLGLTMTTEFVPWSASRHEGATHPSLNWKVTLHKGAKPILTTDYSAGMGHCRSYKQGKMSMDEYDEVKRECQTGHHKMGSTAARLELADVLHSLASDADVIDYSSFEEWADMGGWDTDSRKAEAVYRACLEIGLKLRAALGDAGLAQLREACQDY